MIQIVTKVNLNSSGAKMRKIHKNKIFKMIYKNKKLPKTKKNQFKLQQMIQKNHKPKIQKQNKKILK